MILELFSKLKLDLKKRETVLEAVIKTSIINFFARLFGYGRTFVIAVFLGFNHKTDGFFMALSLIGIFLIFADVFDSIGVPQLVRARLEGRENFKRLAGLLLTFTTFLAFSITIIALILTPFVLKIPAGFNKEALEATKISYFFLIPYLTFSFFFHHFGAVLRSERRFTLYFIGEFIVTFLNFVITALGLYFYKDFRFLPISLSISQGLATLYMFFISKEFLHFCFYVDPEIKKMFNQFLQLLILYGIFHLYVLVDKTFASYIGEKAVSALTYGLIIAGALRNILRFENIAITSLAETGGSIEKLNFYVKRLALLLLPITVILFFFPSVPVKLLFGYGSFSKLDVDLTSEALRFYSLSLFFMFFWPLLYRVFQIRKNLSTIGMVAIIGVCVNASLNYILVFKLKLGITGICLGTFGAYLVICSLGYLLLLKSK